MSTRRFCDFCGAEIRAGEGLRDGAYERKTSLRRHEAVIRTDIRVSIGLDFGEQTYDVCSYCVFRAVRSIDPTPQADTDDDGGEP